jgi:glycosyltransferase involved in cell wall biosynthesis
MTGPLRVLQLAQKPQRRGAEVFASQLSAALRSLGCEVQSAYLYPYEGGAPLPLGAGDTVLAGRPAHPLERAIGVNPGLLREVRRTITAFQPDIVQANGARTVKYAALAKGRGSVAWRLVYRNIGDPARWMVGARQRFFYRHAVMPRLDGVVGVSDATLAGVRARWSIQGPVVRLPRAIDADAFLPSRSRAEVRAALATPADAPVVLYVGSLSADKRPDRLLRVVASVAAELPDVRLWMAGDGPLAAQTTADAARLLGPSATLLGMRDDVADLMYAADVLVLTSDTEGIPGVALEAAAARLPVVATDVGGVAECVVDGVTGAVRGADDEAGLAAALVALLTDPAGRSAMGEQGRRRVVEQFSLAAVARSYVDFYGEVLGRSVPIPGDPAA